MGAGGGVSFPNAGGRGVSARYLVSQNESPMGTMFCGTVLPPWQRKLNFAVL